MSYNYIQILGRFFPDVEAETIRNTSPLDYNNLIFRVGFKTQAELEAAFDAAGAEDEVRVTIDIEQASADDVVYWNGTSFATRRINKFFQAPFLGQANVQNKWLSVLSTSHPTSDVTPFLAPFAANIKTITFGSEVSSGCDLEIYVNGSLSDTVEIRDDQQSVNSITPIALAGGDTVGVFMRKVNGQTKPRNPIVTLWIEHQKVEI